MRIRKIAAFGAIAALALAGCSSNAEEEDDATTPAEGESTEAQADLSGREIDLWLAGGDTPDDLIDYLKSEFNETTGSTLNVDQVDWGELIPRLTTALPNEGETPAVVEVGNTQVSTFSSVGAFTDLTDMWEDLGGDKLGPEGFIEAGTFDGKNFAAPYYWGSRYVFYNEEMLADAGVEVPTTLEEFNAAAVELNTDDVSGMWLGGQDWRNAISWIFANGGEIATQEDGKWVGQLSSPESQEGLKQLQELYSNGTNAGADTTDAELWVPFNEGESAMFMAPSWAQGSIELDEGKFGPLALPGADGGAAPVFAGGSNIAISAASPDQDLAKELMKIIFSDDYQLMLAENGLGPANSTFNSEMGDDAFAEAAIAAAESAKLTPPAPGWAGFEGSGELEDFFAGIYQGKDTAEAAAEFDAAIEKALN